MKNKNISSATPSNARTPEEAMTKIRFAEEEWIYVFGPKRAIMFKGHRNYINPDPRYEPQFIDSVVVHNHPAGTTFSREDVLSIVAADVRKFILVTGSWTYVMERPTNGWPSWFDSEKFESEWRASLNQVEILLMKLISMNEISLHESEVEKMHYIWCVLFTLNGIKNAREENKTT